MINLKKIRPVKNEIYQIGLDDHCLVIGAREARADIPKATVWLSEAMCKWIADNYKKIDFKEQKFLEE